MALTITYEGTDDGDYAEAMLGGVSRWGDWLTIEYNDANQAQTPEVTGKIDSVANGFIVLESGVRVPVGAVVTVTIHDEAP